MLEVIDGSYVEYVEYVEYDGETENYFVDHVSGSFA